jgi:methylated-DNA-[protein]-cysteine S-methyltransferase
MSKGNRAPSAAAASRGGFLHAPPVRVPSGFATLVHQDGKIAAVPLEPSERRLLDVIRSLFPGVRLAPRNALPGVASLLRYAAGRFPSPAEIKALPFDWDAVSAFDREVLEVAAAIPAGKTLSYGEVAAASGHPGAARAAGGALGRNPWPVLIPCHRVIGADGKLTGFGKGLGAKKSLLDFESNRS